MLAAMPHRKAICAYGKESAPAPYSERNLDIIEYCTRHLARGELSVRLIQPGEWESMFQTE